MCKPYVEPIYLLIYVDIVYRLFFIVTYIECFDVNVSYCHLY
jgi:hypothetical protein